MITKTTLITCAVFLISKPIFSNTYYVTASGLASNTGSLNSPWSIDHGFLTALSNDTVYVMAGNYGPVNLVVMNSNTSFIGYTSIPGDLSLNNMPDSLNYYLSTNYSNIYPTIDKADRINGGYAISFNGYLNNVTLRNFQILNYQNGVVITGNNHIIENIIVNGIGDPNVYYDGNALGAYGDKITINNCFVLNSAAEGISVKGDSNLVSYSKVYSTDTSTSYSLTDYYIYVSANAGTNNVAIGNVIDHCYIERIGHTDPKLGHFGHGFCLTLSYSHILSNTGSPPLYSYDPTKKLYAVTNCSITNCTSKNILEGIMLRGDGVRNNFIDNFTSLSYGGLAIQNSCRNNLFNKCHIKNTYYWKHPVWSDINRNAAVTLSASAYGDSTAINCVDIEKNSYPWEQNYGASFNKFTNCLFENIACGVALYNWFEFEYPSYHPLAGQPIDRINRKRIVGNEFINCSFIGRQDTVDILFEAVRGNAQNKMTNCIISGFKNYESRTHTTSTAASIVAMHGIIPTDFTYQNCLFDSNGFDSNVPTNGIIAPIGSGPLVSGFSNAVAGTFINCVVNTNPLFINPINNDYHLQALSPCIDAGTIVTINSDFDNSSRPCNGYFDIGAYEYQNCIITAIKESNTENLIVIYPNPTTTFLHIEVNRNLNKVNVLISDAIGIKVFESAIDLKQGNKFDIDFSNYSSGIYFLKANNETFKIIKTQSH